MRRGNLSLRSDLFGTSRRAERLCDPPITRDPAPRRENFGVETRGGRYERAPRVLWRRAPDRVLVHRVGAEHLELTGVAAFVWNSLDEPCTGRELERDLLDAVAGSPHLDPRATLGTALAR